MGESMRQHGLIKSSHILPRDRSSAQSRPATPVL